MSSFFNLMSSVAGWYLGTSDSQEESMAEDKGEMALIETEPLYMRSSSAADMEVNNQETSPFFNLPGEIRDRIYAFTLADYEDRAENYSNQTYYSRPQYSAHRRSDTAILRTCKRVYFEAWFLPWTCKQHTAWLGNPDRCPEKFQTADKLDDWLRVIHAYHGDVEVDHVRFFAQLWALEPGDQLTSYIKVDNFHPRCITVTLRSSDWWWWEQDDHLHIDGQWVRKCRFPTSLQQLCMELECVERRKEQIDSIAEQMKRTWYFTKKDGSKLFATDTSTEVSRWQGSSILNGERWIRDEIAPGQLSYYVKTVIWRPNKHQSTNDWPEPGWIETQVKPPKLTMVAAALNVDELVQAGVAEDTPGDEALKQVTIWQETVRRRRRIRCGHALFHRRESP